ncbi:hypothetical protein [Sporosarcina sp. JAI121]|uniref:hypothetical protein n=1 Tax=Sporosarcina sp. JAI121 TaxID=2723064 RepID=UPI0015CBB902|nr:hypothetical protein [Sporosarcina sp. JAI121]NYF25705.1 hypothetical protein [Sporosarcina sp. JAI121]
MSMEWFNRVTSELHDHLNSICEQYDQVGHMTIDQSAKHPRIEFFVETEDDERDYFCTLHFDPHNIEFYVETFDYEFEQPTRIILTDTDDVIDAVHDIFHDFINDDYPDDFDEEVVLETGNYRDPYTGEIADVDSFEDMRVEWETPEITAFQIDDKIEVTHQFGVVSATGDGILRRVKRFRSEGNELHKEESSFIFTKEEASTIIALIASNMDKMTSYENQ